MGDEEGVIYAREDCAGFGRRTLILAVDGAAVASVGIALGVAYDAGLPATEAYGRSFFYAWLAFVFAYLVVLESRAATLGFLLADVRIVDLRGNRAAIPRMTLRLLLWVGGPIHPVIDWLWLGGDDQRQTLRDKFVGTLVVRKGAQPAARGPIRLKRYTLLTFSFVFFEVERPAEPRASS